MSEFRLSAQLKGHEGDVRAVHFPSPNLILSSSRDGSVRCWRRKNDKPPTFESSIVYQSARYINTVGFLPPSDAFGPDGLVVYGGGDYSVDVLDPTNPDNDKSRTMVGHTNNICSLAVFPNAKGIVSGSWDNSAVIWNTERWEPSKILVHEGETDNPRSVWAVLPFDDDTIITGSADSYIRVFYPNSTGDMEVAAKRLFKTEDIVRALCKLPAGAYGDADFASAGNDGAITLWNKEKGIVGKLNGGHDSFIYSLACLPSGEIVSSGEDRTVRIWKGKECVQTIVHPAISVWSVAVCSENGDIVSGASDKVVRVFTRSDERKAGPDAMAEFDDAVRSSAIPAPTIDQRNVKSKEWLETNTGNHRQVVMVKESDGSISAYQYTQEFWKWNLVGTVVDSPARQRPKVSYQGKEYDYVFDVDTEDGKPPHKLPYNLGEDTYQAATRFLNDNSLPITYLESVAAFIRQNTQEAAVAPEPEPEPEPVVDFLPHTEYLSISQAKLDAALRKLKEFNSNHIKAGNKHIAMNPDDVKRLEGLVQALSAGPSSAIPNLKESIQLVVNLATGWPYGNRLPALDILRCVVGRAGAASFTDQRYGSLVNIALRAALDTSQPVGQAGETFGDFDPAGIDWEQVNPNNLMMALRTVVNIFSTADGRELAADEAGAVLNLLCRVAGTEKEQVPVGASNLNLYAALITAAFNYACLAYNTRKMVETDLEMVEKLFNISEAVICEQTDAELLFRAVMTTGMAVAIGHLAHELADLQEIETWLEVAQQKHVQDKRIDRVLFEIFRYIEDMRG